MGSQQRYRRRRPGAQHPESRARSLRRGSRARSRLPPRGSRGSIAAGARDDAGLCAIESQLTRQTRPIVYGGGSPDVFHEADASFGAFVETYAAIDPLASVSGVLSLVPNRAALEALARVAGFEDVEFLVPSPHHDVQYLRGDRAVVVGR